MSTVANQNLEEMLTNPYRNLEVDTAVAERCGQDYCIRAFRNLDPLEQHMYIFWTTEK